LKDEKLMMPLSIPTLSISIFPVQSARSFFLISYKYRWLTSPGSIARCSIPLSIIPLLPLALFPLIFSPSRNKKGLLHVCNVWLVLEQFFLALCAP
jgi:hypothetical protein